jgi:hypothetical protein
MLRILELAILPGSSFLVCLPLVVIIVLGIEVAFT